MALFGATAKENRMAKNPLKAFMKADEKSDAKLMKKAMKTVTKAKKPKKGK